MERICNFAAKELKKYWQKMTKQTCTEIRLVHKAIDDLFSEHYVIDVKAGKGVICGDNARSLLLGVYHFLREVGCHFLLPTPKGEVIPCKKAEDISVQLEFTPTHRHRGITLEGSCSGQQVIDLIDWSVKNGFNSYFIQFRTGYTFFERWYSHNFNPYADKEDFDDAMAEQINADLRDAMADRGMIYHAVGHGWTCEPFGIPSRGWDENAHEPEEFADCFAMLDGKRGFFKGVPLNTNLCYSNPKVRKYMVEDILAYAKNRPDVDVLHVWLGDNYNNYCECENCRKKTPSDWYVILLNEIDEALTKAGLSTKIVFLIYFELLFAPKEERIKNQNRFILMFAPITRTYDKSWNSELEKARTLTPPDLTLNHFVPPVDVAENISHYLAWRKIFQGDSFVFDYPLMWDICKEYGGVKLAKTIYGDIHSLKELQLGGYVSCQIQRCFFPTGFAMYVMANSLYDGSLSYETLKNRYFSVAFGKYGEELYQMLEEVSSYRTYTYMKNEISFSDKQMHEEIPVIIERLKDFKKSVGGFMQEEVSPFELRNLRLVDVALELALHACVIIEEKSSEKPDEAKVNELRRALQLWIFSVEPQFETLMDCSYFYTHVDEMSQRK